MVTPTALFDDDEPPARGNTSSGASNAKSNPSTRPISVTALDLSSEPEPAPARRREPAMPLVRTLNLSDKPVVRNVSPQVAALDLSEQPVIRQPTIRAAQATALVLPDLAAQERKPPVANQTPSDVFVVDEHPSVGPAMKRGEERFPDVMKKSGYLVRNNLNAVIPVTFDTLSAYGNSNLSRAADLVNKISEATRAVREVDAENQIQAILDQAKKPSQHMSMFGIIGAAFKHFDPVAAAAHLTAIKEALRLKLIAVEAVREEAERIRDTLGIEVTTLAILADMSDHSADIGGMVNRRGNLFNVSLQEVNMALGQIAAIKKNAQEWVMRCDEVKTVTLPALGFQTKF